MDHLVQALIQNGLLLAAFGWLLKALVSDKLKTISTDISELKRGRLEDTGKIHGIDGRVIRLEEWRENTSSLGRRATDHCPADNCPYEKTDPAITLTGSGAKSIKELLDATRNQGGSR